MAENKYTIIGASGDIIASGLSLTDACIFIRAYCETYYKDFDLRLTIAVMDENLKGSM